MVNKQAAFIFLDLDNTLLNHSRAEKEGLRKTMMSVLGSDSYFEAFHAAYTPINNRLWVDYAAYRLLKSDVRDHRFSDPLKLIGFDHLKEAFTENYYRQYADSWYEVDGASTLLEQLKSNGYHIGLLSNGFADVQHEKLDRMGWNHFFDPIILSEEAGFHKPDIRLFRKAQTACGYAPDRIYYLGDSIESDVNGAAGAGWKPVFFDFNGSGQNPELAVASIRHLADFIPLLNSLE